LGISASPAERAVTQTGHDVRRWTSYAACTWAVLFGAPHLWWALGVSFGFPGGEASYLSFMSSAWRAIYDGVVVVMSALAFAISLALLSPPEQMVRRWIPYRLAWFACGILTIRGVAGIAVDGIGDIWSPTFLVGGILMGSVAWMAK
jgi:hypothetical protein